MTLLLADGFEFYGNGADTQRRRQDRNNVSGNSDTIVTGRFGRGQALTLRTTSGHCQWLIPTPGDVFYAGWSMMIIETTADITAQDLAIFYDDNGQQCTLRLDTDGEVAVDRGATTLATSSGLNLLTGISYYIEWGLTINATTGSFTVHIDGVEWLNETSQNTDNQSSTNANYFAIQGGAREKIIDDFYLCDDAGSVNNGRLGEVEIEGLVPSSDGNRTNWTILSGLTNYEMVDDGTTPDDDSTYNSSSTVLQDDLYGLDNVTADVSVVRAVQVVNHVRLEDAGFREVRALVRSNTDEAQGDNQALGVPWNYYYSLFETDPQGGAAWTETRINAMEAGIELIT